MSRMKLLTWMTGLVLGVGILVPASAQDLRPPELDVQFHRAETAWKSGASVLEAKARIDRVLNERPNDAEALKLRARILMSMNRYDDALPDARQAVLLANDDGEAYLILSEAARLTGDHALAVESLDAAAERVMEDAEFHIRLSWNAALLGQLDRSEAYARIALALAPERPQAYYQLARVFIRKEQLDDAASILVRGLGLELLDPNVIQSDTILTAVVDHASLVDLLK